MDSPIVLCIDDRPQALEFRKATLESRGYCVKTASSGSTAIKMLLRRRPPPQFYSSTNTKAWTRRP